MKTSPTNSKYFISANELLNDSFQLAALVEDSGYIPDLVVGIWRGGGPIAIAVHEFFHYKGHELDHLPLRITSYTGIGQQAEKIDLYGSEYFLERLFSSSEKVRRLLIVDDVFDSGRSLASLLLTLESGLESALESAPKAASELRPQNQNQNQPADLALPEIRIACPWYKPANNKTSLTPDYYLHETDQWLVFPHELMGLSEEEIKTGKAGTPIANPVD